MRANARRYRRYRICMPVSVLLGKDKLRLQTADIGMSGVFLRTEMRPKEGALVRIAVELPLVGEEVALLGRVSSVRQASASGRPAGVGVAFYGNGPAERDLWQKFVRAVEQLYPKASEHDVHLPEPAGDTMPVASSKAQAVAKPAPPPLPPALPLRRKAAKAEAPPLHPDAASNASSPLAPQPVIARAASVEPEPELDIEVEVERYDAAAAADERRRFRRFEVDVQVKAYFDSLEDLVLMHTRDVSQGGMFIATNIATAEGESLTLRVVHPDTLVEFPIKCVVRRCVSDGSQPGLAVEFQLDAPGRERFWSFISAAVIARAESSRRSVNYF